jgi:tryptophanyl-tRNA synthetase
MTRVFSGIQPTGQKHLGNLLGAIRHYVADQEAYGSDALFCVVDLHSMTVPFDPPGLRTATLDLVALLVAAGLDPDRCVLFVQSHVHEHSELAWILNCVATMGELGRMTQYKSKSEGKESVSVGLFDYPVLQAADVLAYRATRVPVGDDQRQHLELMRDLAERFNARFGETFPLPVAAIPREAARVRDLQNPAQRMSTTQSTPDGKVLVLDPPEAVRKKFKRCVTDSGTDIVAREDKPGISNLLEIFAAVTGTTVSDLEARYVGKGYGALKVDVGDAVAEYLRPIRERYTAIRDDAAALDRAIQRGAERAQAIAAPVLVEVKERLGLVRRP